MELNFEYDPERQFYAIRFVPGAYESLPFINELRFWGVSRTPCPQLSTLAALIALKGHPVTAITLRETISDPVCSALAHQFGVSIHPSSYDINRRSLAGGDKLIRPVRFSAQARRQNQSGQSEELAWISLDDLGGPFGGQIRTNVDAFNIDESEKNLIVALCCAGKELGHVVLEESRTELARLCHRIGLELIQNEDA